MRVESEASLFACGPPEFGVEREKVLAEVRRRLLGRVADPLRFSRYVVGRRIASGGGGVVYEAVDPHLSRAVAIKVVRTGGAGSRADRRNWLLREANALAQLSHPNVLPIYDQGLCGDGDDLFLVTELVEGEDLEQWLARGPHGWRATVAAFCAAGRGLAASHRIGLVHRDFKPANVLIGRGGEIRVADFGLALEFGSDPDGRKATEQGSGASGTVAGTPSYMSPEQHRGEPADPRSDQYSVCASLYEALYGRPPFPMASLRELSAAKQRGDIPPPPFGSAAPRRLWRTLRRGLDPDPSRRFDSMSTLVEQLAGNPLRRGRRVWAVAALSTVGIVAAAAAVLDGGTPCPGGDDRIAEVWNTDRQVAIRTALLSAGVVPAERTAVETAIGSYTNAWAQMHRDACESTRIRGVQPEKVLDLRFACLLDRRAELSSALDVLGEADPVASQRAVSIVSGLTPISSCADGPGVERAVLPPDPTRSAAVVELRAKLHRAAALRAGGKLRQGLEIAQMALVASESVGYGPVQVEARYRVASLLPRAEVARREYERSFFEASALGHHRVAAAAATALAFQLGHVHEQTDEALAWAKHAGAAVERSGSGLHLEAELENALGATHERAASYPEALQHYRRELELLLTDPVRNEPRIAMVYSNVGGVLTQMRDDVGARRALDHALEISERIHGPEHPRIAEILNNLGNSLESAGHPLEAERHHRRALAIRQSVYGANHRVVGASTENLANALRGQQRTGEAVELHRRALAIYRKAVGARHPWTASAHGNLGAALLETGRLNESLPHLRHALEITRQTHGHTHPRVAVFANNLGTALAEQGDTDAAADQFERAISVWEATLGRHHPNLAHALTGLGAVRLDEGRPEEAIALLERARSVRNAVGARAGDTAETLFLLARAQWEGGRGVQRPLALARQARQIALNGRPPDPSVAGDIETWLADAEATATTR